ncbi:MAG: hypothetical protein GY769_13170 [bacterium]|nr:hypothetical protein [bacterium]
MTDTSNSRVSCSETTRTRELIVMVTKKPLLGMCVEWFSWARRFQLERLEILSVYRLHLDSFLMTITAQFAVGLVGLSLPRMSQAGGRPGTA